MFISLFTTPYGHYQICLFFGLTWTLVNQHETWFSLLASWSRQCPETECLISPLAVTCSRIFVFTPIILCCLAKFDVHIQGLAISQQCLIISNSLACHLSAFPLSQDSTNTCGQIYFTISTNTFWNLDKYILQFDKYILQCLIISHSLACHLSDLLLSQDSTNTCGQIYFTISTNTFYNLDKYIGQFGQIRFAKFDH